jgi:hypothetical protein
VNLLSVIHLPQLRRLGRGQRVSPPYSYFFFSGTVACALTDATTDYSALSHDLGPWMTLHGAIIVLARLGFGHAVHGQSSAALDRIALKTGSCPRLPPI